MLYTPCVYIEWNEILEKDRPSRTKENTKNEA